MEFIIDTSHLEKSFDDIAKQLLLEHVISVNETDLEITEIEFYYFNSKFHLDKYTHPHKRNSGEWRFHNQGIDITFQHEINIQDGGILIRGIKDGITYINGPRKTLDYIFEKMGKVCNVGQLQLRHKSLPKIPIIKTFRHLPNKIQFEEYHKKKYRYIKNFEYLNIAKKAKDQISADYESL